MEIYPILMEDSGDAVFNYNEMGIVNIDPNNISVDDNFILVMLLSL